MGVILISWRTPLYMIGLLSLVVTEHTGYAQSYGINAIFVMEYQTVCAPIGMLCWVGEYIKGTSLHKALNIHFIHFYFLLGPHGLMLWEKFQWILPLYMKPISFQSKPSVVCSVTAAVFIGFCLKKLNAFSQHIDEKKQMNIWIPQKKSPGIEMLINFLC